MKILITGAKGFIGKNFCAALKNIRDGRDCRKKYATLLPLTLFECDRETTHEELDTYCAEADFVFNLAGVNRPENPQEFKEGNTDFAGRLLDLLERHSNTCPVMLASSAQASLEGRFANSKYGKSKLAGEELFRAHSKRSGAPVLIYRFPNVYGKWCRPNYNSVIATFCNNIANNLPIQVHDESTRLHLFYIDDLVRTLLDAAVQSYAPFEGADTFYEVTPVDTITLGEIVNLLLSFKNARETLEIPKLNANSFTKKLYSTYESYVDPTNLAYTLPTKQDIRGSFTEMLRTPDRGQISINVTAPGETKGNHWHNTKWEKFIAVAGEGIIKQRRVGTDEQGNSYPTVEYAISSNTPTIIETPPGFTHNLHNPSSEADLVTIIWSNEVFNPENPDTYFEEV